MFAIDDAFEAMGAAPRRRLLVTLLETERVGDRPVAVGDGRSRERALLQHHHIHLPKLEALDLIRWDRQRGEVTRGPAFAEVRPLVELLDGRAEELPGEWP
jgi:hypothetical protein